MRAFASHIQNALESLAANRMRTFLTMLGVLVGIASMTIIFSLSGGLGQMIIDQVTDQGGAIVVVRPKEPGVNNKNIISYYTFMVYILGNWIGYSQFVIVYLCCN